MERRTLLLSTALVAGIFLSGCSLAPLQNEVGTISVNQSTGSFEIGDRVDDVNPHPVTIGNNGSETRTFTLSVAAPVRNETLLKRSYSLSPGETVQGEFHRPAYYELTVSLSGSATRHSEVIDYFDYCNSYATTVTIQANGNISSWMGSTMAGCERPEFPTPEPTETA